MRYQANTTHYNGMLKSQPEKYTSDIIRDFAFRIFHPFGITNLGQSLDSAVGLVLPLFPNYLTRILGRDELPNTIATHQNEFHIIKLDNRDIGHLGDTCFMRQLVTKCSGHVQATPTILRVDAVVVEPIKNDNTTSCLDALLLACGFRLVISCDVSASRLSFANDSSGIANVSHYQGIHTASSISH